MKKAIVALATGVCHLGLWLAAAALLVIVALNAVNIVLRYFFFSALPWAEEAMLYLMIFGVYAAAVSVAWEQVHIRIDAFINLAPRKWRRPLGILSTLLVAAILAPVLLASYRVTSMLFEFDQRSDALHLPIWIPQSVVPGAILLIILMSLLRAIFPAADHRDAPSAHGSG
jgi:TRAP-type C4-dicarboxylate transport system permease small subunit